MTGLQKIIAQINADTDSTCADINKKAQNQCNDIINSAHIEADKIRNVGDIEAKAQFAEILKRAEFSAQLQKRSVMLNAKQEIISSSISAAMNYFCSLPIKEYFQLIYTMVEKYSEPAEGMIAFSSKDMERLPVDFIAEVNNYAKGKLTLSEESEDIKGGFILKYGGIDVNCTFESIFLSEREHIADIVSEILFSHGGSI